MLWIEGGTFMMGSDDHYLEEAPAHLVELDGFWIDATLVTNEQFSRFVDATGYVTVAERPRDPRDDPDVPPERLKPGGMVFQKPPVTVGPDDYDNTWVYKPGTDWRHPLGPESCLDSSGHIR